MAYPVAIHSFANKNHLKLWESIPINGDGLYSDIEKSKRRFVDEFGNGILIKKLDKYYIITNFHIICKNDIFISQINILDNKISLLSKLVNTFPEFDLAIMEVIDITLDDINLSYKPLDNNKINNYLQKFNKSIELNLIDKYSLSIDNLINSYNLEDTESDKFMNICYNTNIKNNKIEYICESYKFENFDINFGFTKMMPQIPIYNFKLNPTDNFMNMCGKSGSGMYYENKLIGLLYKVNPVAKNVIIIPSCIIKKIMMHEDIKNFNTKLITGNLMNVSYNLDNTPDYTQHGHILYELICDTAYRINNDADNTLTNFIHDYKSQKFKYIITSIDGQKFNNFHKIYNSDYNQHMTLQSNILLKSLDDINEFKFTMINPNTEKEFDVIIKSCNFYDKLKIPIAIEDRKFFYYKGLIFTELSEEIFQYICMNEQIYNLSQSIHFAILKPFNHNFENIYILIDYIKDNKLVKFMKSNNLLVNNKLNCSILYKINNKIFEPDSINLNKVNNISLLINNDVNTSDKTFINFKL